MEGRRRDGWWIGGHNRIGADDASLCDQMLAKSERCEVVPPSVAVIIDDRGPEDHTGVFVVRMLPI